MEKLSKILVVDDEPDIREIASIALERMGGYTVQLCADGPSAIATAAEFQPQLVLLDMMMPQMDGLQTLDELRKIPATAEVPIIFVTAKAQPDELALYKEKSGADVISKPFDPLVLPAAVQEIWDNFRAKALPAD